MVDTAAPDARRPSAGRRPVTVAVVLLVLAALVASARSAGRATVEEVLEIPDLGTVRADRLGNGTPVFVVSTAGAGPGGTAAIDVIQAFVPEVSGPVTALVGWCADAGAFVDPHHGPLYDVRGRRLPTTLAGRTPAGEGTRLTALDDLIHRVATPIEGRTEAADPITVEGIQPLQDWQVADRPELDPRPAPRQCRRPADPPVTPTRAAPIPTLVDHSFLATAIDPGRLGWQITDGWLVIDVDGRGRWCDEPPGPLPDAACAAPREDVDVGLALDPADVGGVPAVLGGPLAVRLSGGAVARVAVLPDSGWWGSSLRGSEPYAGQVVRAWTSADPALVIGDLVGAGRCRATFPGGQVDGRATARLPVTARTVVEVAGEVGAADDGPPGPALAGAAEVPLDVDLVVDAATCEVLMLRAG
jgi:hypothetical protein